MKFSEFNWKQGALRLWIVASMLWCTTVFFTALWREKNISWLPIPTPAIHVKVSNTETWDYPADWDVQRIRDDLQKRMEAEDKKDADWAAQVSTSRRAVCDAIPSTTPFSGQPADCVRLFFAERHVTSAAPAGWESQVATAFRPMSPGPALNKSSSGSAFQLAKAPGCRNGGFSCEPWEREWGEGGLKPGLVVTEKGLVIGLSAWGIIAAAAPWAIAPPFVVLALGVAFFWVAAGFRKAA